MTDGGPTTWKTVKVPEGDKERADDYRPDGATWGDCLVAGAERLNDSLDSDTRAYLDGTEGVDVDALASALTDEISVEQGVEADALARRVAAQIDHAELAKQVADELEVRL